MIVHLAVPTHKIQQNMAIYERMITAIHECGGSLARDWLHPAYRRPEELSDDVRRAKIVEKVEDAILRADVSNRGTAGIGLQIAWALQHDKPVLALQRQDTPEGVLTGGLNDPLYIYCRTDDVVAAIKVFLKENA